MSRYPISLINQALGRNGRGFKARKSFMMALDPQTIPAFSSWMLENGLAHGGEAQALREMMLAQLSASPMDAAVEAGRSRAYAEAREAIWLRFRQFMDELRHDFREGPRGAGSTTEGEPPDEQF